MANPRTQARIESRIHERAAHCLEFEINDPRATFITVTRVEISSDLSIAKIYYSVLGGDSERSLAKHMLIDANGYIRKQIGRVLRMRRIPRIDWYFDEKIEYQKEMEAMILAALHKDRNLNPDAHPGLTKEAPKNFGTVRTENTDSPSEDGEDESSEE